MSEGTSELATPAEVMGLSREEMYFRRVYEPLVCSGVLRTVFRSGIRVYPQNKGYSLGEIVTARVLLVPGDDKYLRPPIFSEVSRRIRIATIAVSGIDQLRPEDFIGSSPDVYDKTSLQYHLGLIYNLPPDAFSVVTRFGLEYL